jgi:hypothetical protein
MPLVAFREAIITEWQALTPPDPDPGRKYHYVEGPLDGISSHRSFWFEIIQAGGIAEQGSARHGIDWVIEATIRLAIPEKASNRFDQPYREFQTLAARISRMRVPQVMVPQVVGARVVPATEGKETDLILTITARTKESSQ